MGQSDKLQLPFQTSDLEVIGNLIDPPVKGYRLLGLDDASADF